MEYSVCALPFHKLKYAKYMTLEVLMYVKYKSAINFMFYLNKESRLFLHNNSSTFYNGFINDGLIEYEFFSFKSFYDHYELLEKLYFEALKRKICNRIITLKVYLWD